MMSSMFEFTRKEITNLVTRRMSYRKQKQLILREHLGLTLVVDGVLLPYLSSFLCCVIALSSFPLDVTNRKVICIESQNKRKSNNQTNKQKAKQTK
jgi:hypothetical protein